MGAEDDFRKVAEDVRELARSLRAELRSAKWDARSYKAARHDLGRWGGWTVDPERPDRYRNGVVRYYKPPRREWAPRTPVPPPYEGGGPAPRRSAGRAPVAVATAPPPPRPKSDLPPVRHKRDASTLLSILLVMVGLAWLASTTRLFDFTLEEVLAVALAVLGGAMVITARTDWSLSRKHWPVWVGAVLLVVLVGSATGASIQSRLSSLHFGPVDEAITSWNGTPTFENFAGPVRLDLTGLKAGGPDRTLVVRDTFGPIDITVPAHPAGYRIHVTANTVFGPEQVNGARGSLTDVGTSGPTLTLDVKDVFGPVTVITVDSPPPPSDGSGQSQ